MSAHAAAPASAYATYRTWGLRALRNDATSAGGRGSAWGERVRDEAGRETRARVVGAARAWETRARNASRRSRDHDVDLYRPCRRSARWRARRLRSRIGRLRRDPTTRSRDAVTRHRILPRRDRLGRGPRKHVPSTPAACKSRVASSEDAILLFARVCDGQVRQSLADARARARSRRTAVFFPWENVTAWFFIKSCKTMGV
jgi:hypothetical protein